MDQKKIWDHFQAGSEADDAFADAGPRYAYLAKPIARGAAVLNIGVGRGGLERILQAKGAVVSCLDPSEGAVERLRTTLALADRAQVGFAQAIPFASGKFDAVVMSEVLEHLDDDVLALTLAEIHRVLRSGGTFYGTVPADEDVIRERVVCPHCGEQFHRWGHLQSFSERRVKVMLAERFFDVHVTRHYFGDFRRLNWKGRFGWILKKLALGIGITGGNENFYFSARVP